MPHTRAVIVLESTFLLVSCMSSSGTTGTDRSAGPRDAGTNLGETIAEDASPEGAGGEDAGPDDQNVGDASPDDTTPADVSVDATATADQELCQGACDVTAGISCPDRPAVDCVRRCEAQLAQNVCASEIRAHLACEIAATPSAYFCMSPPDATVLMPGFCQAEIHDLNACVNGDAGA